MDGRWYQTSRSISTEVESIIHAMNPGMLNLIDMQGAATEARGKVQYAKMGIADKKAYRRDKTTNREIVADSVPILRVERDGFEVTRLFIYADGVFGNRRVGRTSSIERSTVSIRTTKDCKQSWTHSLRQRDKWQLRSLQARISLERKESHDEEIPPQSFCGI